MSTGPAHSQRRQPLQAFDNPSLTGVERARFAAFMQLSIADQTTVKLVIIPMPSCSS
jgi:hypothetical protein